MAFVLNGWTKNYVHVFNFARYLLFESEQRRKNTDVKKEIHDVKDIAGDVVAAKATNSKSRSLTLFVIDGKKLFPGRTVRMAAAGGRLQAAE